MYKKFLLEYKMYQNGHRNAFTLCIEGADAKEIEGKKKEALSNFRQYPITAKDFQGNPLYGFGQIPYSVTIQ